MIKIYRLSNQLAVINKLKIVMDFAEIIRGISDGSQYQENFDTIDLIIKAGGDKPDRQMVKQLLESINNLITTANVQPICKFYSINIVKDLSMKKYSTYLTGLSSSKVLQTMIKIAKTTDPTKRMEEKGKSLFKDPELGNKYITLILECICQWAQKYPDNSQKQPTKFRQGYMDLVKENVVLPKTYHYFKVDSKQSNKPKKEDQKVTPGEPGPKKDERSPEVQIRFNINKIEGLYERLEEYDPAQTQQFEKQIKSFHKQFEKEQNGIGALFERGLNEDLTNAALILNEFYFQQNLIYEQFMKNKDINEYIQKVLNTNTGIDKYFSNPNPNNGKTVNFNSTNSNKPAQSKYDEERQREKEVQRQRQQQMLRQQQQRQRQRQSELQKRNSKIEKEKKDSSKVLQAPSFSNLNELQRQNENHKTQLTRMLNKGKDKVGFGVIQQQMERQRSHFKSTRVRSHSPMVKSKAPFTKSQYEPGARLEPEQQYTNNSVSQSKVSIFDLHLDVKVTRNNYTGAIVPYNSNYFESQIEDMHKNQSIRRLKMAILKQKALLFENEHIQIGFRSEVIYQQQQTYHVFLKLSLFFGNKSTSAISHFDIDYEGDQTNVLYCNPIRVESVVEASDQLKQELMIIPMDVPFTLMNFKIKYMHNRSIQRFNILLPNSILKFTDFINIDRNSWKREYSAIKKIKPGCMFRTQHFKLSRSLPPASLKKYIVNLLETTNYDEFIAQKSYVEYKLIAKVSVIESEVYLLKFRIRPNMTVVIQLACTDDSADSIKYGKFLLQSLQFLLFKQD